MTRRAACGATLGLFVALIAGCSGDAPQPPEPADERRIVTLAPHLAELVFAAGAGDTLVGVSAYTDHPAEAAGLTVVSDAFTVDQEQLRLLSPTLVLAWESGTPRHLVAELIERGYRVEALRTHGLDDIAAAIERIGELTDTSERAAAVARQFRAELQALRQTQVGKHDVSVFYQVSLKPLYTISDAHYIGEIIVLCGGTNAFSGLGDLAPAVTVEAVVAANPDAILASSAEGDAAFTEWRRWQHLTATRFENFFSVDADSIGRPSLRLVDAARSVCGYIDAARGRLAASS
ncbi:MAG: helical backbone metal receptor [Woeseiaceae bacterium]|nr:helical backbone metal receptor [Woeseiaceae bacterium]